MHKMIRPPILLVLAAVLLVGLALGILGVQAWVSGYLSSEGFRNSLNARIGSILDAQVEIQPLKWEGSGVFTEGLTARRGMGWVSDLKVDQLRAQMDWRSLWGGVWKITQIEALGGEAVLQKQALVALSASAVQPPAPSGFLNKTKLDSVILRRMTLRWNSEDGIPGFLLRESEIWMEPRGASLEFSALGGKMETRQLPALELVRAHGRLSEGVFFLTGATFRSGESGRILVSGEFGPRSVLRVEGEGVDVTVLLSEFWRSRLAGKLAGNMAVHWTDEGREPMADGRLVLSEGRLENLPLLKQLADFTGSPQFARMAIQEASGNFTRSAGVLQVSQFVLESKGLLRIEGDFSVRDSDGALSGQLNLGVSSQTLQYLPGSRERVFTESRDGYQWTKMALSGTTADPQEDLTPRLMGAMGAEAISTGLQMIESTPSLMKNGSETLQDGANEFLKVVAPLLGP